jgi:hypothetical protein
MTPTPSPDVETSFHGSIVTLRPLTMRGRAELERLKTEPWQWTVHGLACELHMACDVIRFLSERGFIVRDAGAM